MRLEISNPSDKATIDCSDRIAACIAVCIIGRGRYGIIDDESDNGMPIFLLGGSDEWFQDQFNTGFHDAFEKTGRPRIATALESVQLEQGRSSMNDFTSRAHDIAKQLREHAAAEADS
ncbi:hypothetical protein [Neptunomonas japonica]|uniref:Uncharacterized protein n=1 Tax=Neptunomonas japonica JAMM 1380 TaxID=1441457 RepID=A0A7R6P8T5_9GAMM|nr:hypothetical protein [Neptunomonas japonica]BBB29343.1 conserved hypothetical protein [Neptunomonas japonica JAMM 1380]